MKRKQPRKTAKKAPTKKAATATAKPKATAKAKRARPLENKKSPILAFNYRDASRLSGIRTATLQKWILEGVVTRGEDGSFNITKLLELSGKEGQALKSGVGRSPEAQKSYEKYWSTKAETLALNLHIQKGELLDREEVTTELINRELVFKNRLLGLPNVFASQLPGCTPPEIEQVTRKAICDVLRDLARQGSEAYAKRMAEDAQRNAE
jgi:hypothetical protein